MPATRRPFTFEEEKLPNAHLYLDDLAEIVAVLEGDEGAKVSISNPGYTFDSVEDFEGWKSKDLYPLVIERETTPAVAVRIPSFGRAVLRLHDDTLAAKTTGLLVTSLFRRRRSLLRDYGWLIRLVIFGAFLLVWALDAVVDSPAGEDALNLIAFLMMPLLPLLVIATVTSRMDARTVITTRTRADSPSWWSQNWRGALWDVGLLVVGIIAGAVLSR